MGRVIRKRKELSPNSNNLWGKFIREIWAGNLGLPVHFWKIYIPAIIISRLGLYVFKAQSLYLSVLGLLYPIAILVTIISSVLIMVPAVGVLKAAKKKSSIWGKLAGIHVILTIYALYCTSWNSLETIVNFSKVHPQLDSIVAEINGHLPQRLNSSLTMSSIEYHDKKITVGYIEAEPFGNGDYNLLESQSQHHDCENMRAYFVDGSLREIQSIYYYQQKPEIVITTLSENCLSKEAKLDKVSTNVADLAAPPTLPGLPPFAAALDSANSPGEPQRIAQAIVGLYYLKSGPSFRNPQLAANWFRKSAEQGYDEAEYHLGIMYETGDGIEKNHEEALKWLQKAAEQKQPEAINSLRDLKHANQ